MWTGENHTKSIHRYLTTISICFVDEKIPDASYKLGQSDPESYIVEKIDRIENMGRVQWLPKLSSVRCNLPVLHPFRELITRALAPDLRSLLIREVDRS
jgi:hypothetical protein